VKIGQDPYPDAVEDVFPITVRGTGPTGRSSVQRSRSSIRQIVGSKGTRETTGHRVKDVP